MTSANRPIPPDAIRSVVTDTVRQATVTDMHTHLFAPEFGSLNLWGIDALLTYHYLVAELFRVHPQPYESFWAMSLSEQADLVWQKLFVERPPVSEAAQGVVRVLTELGLDPCARDLRQAREFFAAQDPAAYAEQVLDMAKVDLLVMTNDPFDPAEERVWSQAECINPRYTAALRLDMLLTRWEDAAVKLGVLNADAKTLSHEAVLTVRRFLDDWVARMKPVYLAASLPSDFAYPDGTPRTVLLREAVLPTCQTHDLPMALMIGVRRQVNPGLRLAGDAVGRADVTVLERLANEFPGVRYLVTMLSRENQHELCVMARKFGNILPFGCWWFLNNPSIVLDITRQRLEMLGATFVAQHSDARVLDQLLYKWPSSRTTIAQALSDTYEGLASAGRPVTQADIAADVNRLLRENFRRFAKLT